MRLASVTLILLDLLPPSAAFAADADGIGPAADPHVRNLFLRDRTSGTTTLVSRAGADKPNDTDTKPKPSVLSGLTLSPNRFRDGPRTAIVFELTGAARVAVKFELLAKKRRARRARTLTVTGRRRDNKVKVSGNLRGKALKAGRYRLTATPRLGRAHTTRFAVTAAPRRKR